MFSHFSHVQLFAAPWTIAHEAFLSIEFSRQGYWHGLPCPPPGESPNPGIKPASPALQAEVTYPKCRARIWIQAYIFPNFTFFSLICYLPGNRRKNLREQWSLLKTPPTILSYQAPLLSCVQLFGTPMDCNPTGSSVHVIFQERILEWMAISFSRGSSQPRDQTCVSCVSCVGTWILYPIPSGNPAPTTSFYPVFLFPLSICSVGALRPIQWTRHPPGSGSWLGCFLCAEILSTKIPTWFMLISPSGLSSNTTFTVRLSDHDR